MEDCSVLFFSNFQPRSQGILLQRVEIWRWGRKGVFIAAGVAYKICDENT